MSDVAQTVEAFGTWSIIKFAFTTGLFTAAFTQVFAWLKDVSGAVRMIRATRRL